MENKLNRAVIYCRVSTKEQVEEGNSLVTQEKNCRDYAKKNGYEVAEVFIELGESAKTADRTELQKLFVYCSNKKNSISAVIAYKIDRISRNTDDYSQIRILLKRYGVEIKSTSEYFENTPAGRFMENIIANVAQFDNDVRTERSIGGMKQAVSEGRYVWMAPLGYSNVKVNGKSTIAPNEYAETVKLIFEQIASKQMTAEGVRQHIISTTKISMSKSKFYRILGNKLYIGKLIKFGQETIGTFEPLISAPLFSLTQQVLNRKYETRHYLAEHPDFPLRRFIKSLSGNYLTGCWCKGKNKKFAYYRLPNNGKMIRKRELESTFVKYLNSFSIEVSLLKDFKERIMLKFRDSSALKKINADNLTVKEKELLEKRQSLVDKNLKGVIPDDLLKEQLEIVNTELWKTQESLAKAKNKTIDLDFIFKRLAKFLKDPGGFWYDQPIHIKRKLQKFEFPDGLTLVENKFQTQNICSLFKLKSVILENLSTLVHHPNITIKHPQSANSPLSNDAQLIALFEKIQSDLIVVEEILNFQDD